MKAPKRIKKRTDVTYDARVSREQAMRELEEEPGEVQMFAGLWMLEGKIKTNPPFIAVTAFKGRKGKWQMGFAISTVADSATVVLRLGEYKTERAALKAAEFLLKNDFGYTFDPPMSPFCGMTDEQEGYDA